MAFFLFSCDICLLQDDKKTLENCNLSVFATHEKGAQKKPPTRRKKKKTFPCINVKSSSKHWKKLKSFIAIQE